MAFPVFKSAPRLDVTEQTAAGEKAVSSKVTLSPTPAPAAKREQYFYLDQRGDFDIAKYDFKLEASQVPLCNSPRHSAVLGWSSTVRISVLPGGEFVGCPVEAQGTPRYYETTSWGASHKHRIRVKEPLTALGDDFVVFEDESPDILPTLATEEAVPSDGGWMRLVDAALNDSRHPRRARIQRAMAIVCSGLREHPTHEQLIQRFMDLQMEIQPVHVLMQLWKLVRQTMRKAWSVRLFLLESYSQWFFVVYSVQEDVDHHLELLADLGAAPDNALRSAVEQRIFALLLSSGHGQVVLCAVYHAIWSRAGQDDFAVYWTETKRRLATLQDPPSVATLEGRLLTELLIDFALPSTLQVAIEPLSRGVCVDSLRFILRTLGIDFAGPDSTLDMTHGCWSVATDFTVAPTIVLSNARLLSIRQLVQLLMDLEGSFESASLWAVQLLLISGNAGEALRLIKSVLARQPSDHLLWHNFVMLLRAGKSDNVLSVVEKIVASPELAKAPEGIKLLLSCDHCETLCLLRRQQEARDIAGSILGLAAFDARSIDQALSGMADVQLARRWAVILSQPWTRCPLPRRESSICSPPSPLSVTTTDVLRVRSRADAQLFLQSLVQSTPFGKVDILRACLELVRRGYLERVEVEELDLILEEKGCHMYGLLHL